MLIRLTQQGRESLMLAMSGEGVLGSNDRTVTMSRTERDANALGTVKDELSAVAERVLSVLDNAFADFEQLGVTRGEVIEMVKVMSVTRTRNVLLAGLDPDETDLAEMFVESESPPITRTQDLRQEFGRIKVDTMSPGDLQSMCRAICLRAITGNLKVTAIRNMYLSPVTKLSTAIVTVCDEIMRTQAAEATAAKPEVPEESK